MTRIISALRRKRPTRAVTIAAAAVAVTLSLTLPVAAIARGGHSGAVPPPPAAPTSASQIQNIDQVKTAIKAYYGDTVGTMVAPGDPNMALLHQYGADSAYAHEMAGIEARATRYLSHPYAQHRTKKHHGHKHGSYSHGQKAIVLDVDDTTLSTYSYEIWSNFVYNPATNANFVNAGSAKVFPATPGMPQLVSKAAAKGYTVFYLTGRPGTQRDGTVANLSDAGYAAPDAAHLYLKDYTADTWLSSCAPSCTTIQYKSLTRRHIESLGYNIVGNFGDQFSDLKGGFADRGFKLPNPMYYLP